MYQYCFNILNMAETGMVLSSISPHHYERDVFDAHSGFSKYSASSVIRTSIIRILDYPNPQNNYIHKILMIFMPH